LIALLLCVTSVTFCYFAVDRPVAFYVHDHNFAQDAVLKWLTYPPPILQAYVPVVLVGLMVRRAWGPFHRWELALLAARLSLLTCVGHIGPVRSQQPLSRNEPCRRTAEFRENTKWFRRVGRPLCQP
jgi:hypothetical protein